MIYIQWLAKPAPVWRGPFTGRGCPASGVSSLPRLGVRHVPARPPRRPSPCRPLPPGCYVLPSGWTFNGQLAAGLTPDAPNFVFSLRGSRSF